MPWQAFLTVMLEKDRLTDENDLIEPGGDINRRGGNDAHRP